MIGCTGLIRRRLFLWSISPCSKMSIGRVRGLFLRYCIFEDRWVIYLCIFWILYIKSILSGCLLYLGFYHLAIFFCRLLRLNLFKQTIFFFLFIFVPFTYSFILLIFLLHALQNRQGRTLHILFEILIFPN